VCSPPLSDPDERRPGIVVVPIRRFEKFPAESYLSPTRSGPPSNVPRIPSLPPPAAHALRGQRPSGSARSPPTSACCSTVCPRELCRRSRTVSEKFMRLPGPSFRPKLPPRQVAVSSTWFSASFAHRFASFFNVRSRPILAKDGLSSPCRISSRLRFCRGLKTSRSE